MKHTKEQLQTMYEFISFIERHVIEWHLSEAPDKDEVYEKKVAKEIDKHLKDMNNRK